MANYFSHFSFVVPVDDPAGVLAELELLIEDAVENDGSDTFPASEGIPYGLHVAVEDSDLWISDDAGEGSVEGAVAVTQWLLAKPGAPDVVIVEWAHTCSKPRLDAYGGGAAVVTKDDVEWIVAGIIAADKAKEAQERVDAARRRAAAGLVRYEITVAATASIEETWQLDAPPGLSAEEAWEATDGMTGVTVTDRVTGDEDDREVVAVRQLDTDPKGAADATFALADGSHGNPGCDLRGVEDAVVRADGRYLCSKENP